MKLNVLIESFPKNQDSGVQLKWGVVNLDVAIEQMALVVSKGAYSKEIKPDTEVKWVEIASRKWVVELLDTEFYKEIVEVCEYRVILPYETAASLFSKDELVLHEFGVLVTLLNELSSVPSLKLKDLGLATYKISEALALLPKLQSTVSLCSMVKPLEVDNTWS